MEILNLIVPIVVLIVQVIVIAAGGQMKKYNQDVNTYDSVKQQNSFILVASIVSLVLAGVIAACHFVKTIPKKIHNLGRMLLFGFQSALAVVMALLASTINKTPDFYKNNPFDSGKSYYGLSMASAVLLWILCIPSVLFLIWPLVSNEESAPSKINTSSTQLK